MTKISNDTIQEFELSKHDTILVKGQNIHKYDYVNQNKIEAINIKEITENTQKLKKSRVINKSHKHNLMKKILDKNHNENLYIQTQVLKSGRWDRFRECKEIVV